MSDRRPMESANHAWAQDEAAANVAQMGQVVSEHSKAMNAPVPVDVPPVPDPEP